MAARTAICALAFLLIAATVSGQAPRSDPPPNFSGTWRLDDARSNTEGAGGWFGDIVRITQNDKTVTFASGGTGVGSGATTYAIGTPGTSREFPSGTRTDAALWSGSRLVLTSVFTPKSAGRAGTTSTRTVTVSLDPAGAMIVDVTENPEAGGRFARHSVYVK